MISIEDIEKLAKLSRLKLSSEEKEKYRKDMENILAYIGQIDKAAPAAGAAKAGDLRNVMREDIHPHDSGIYTDDLIKLAPKSEKNWVKVKKIL